MRSQQRPHVGFAMLFALCLSILSCSESKDDKSERGLALEGEFSVVLYDSDYAQALSRMYRLDRISIRIVMTGSVVGESDSVVYDRQLSESEKLRVADFFGDFPLTALQDHYATPAVEDGDQKVFVFAIGNVEKQVQVANYYQNDLGAVVDLLNSLVPDEFRIT